MTGDRWQVTRDKWQVTRDTWHMTHSVGRTFSQNFSSLALPVWDWQCLEYISTNHRWVNEWMTEVFVEQPRLHRVCQKIFWHVTGDTWHLTGDRWHMTRDMWHVTHDTWHIVLDEHSLKISAPQHFRFGIDSVWNIFPQTMSYLPYLINEWITRLFIEQPRLHRVC